MFGGTFPPPRPFQEAAHEALRAGARAGHRCQIIQAPTGSGKTYLGMRVVNEAVKRGKRAMFLCDRKTLINQTSAVAEDYGLWDHGIIQASNPRMDLSKLFQIASVQTLMRRGWPEVDVLIVDEAHTLYKTWVDHITSDECKAMVVGLSATPFTKGLGKVFSNLVNAATMHDLVESGVLVPMRIFSCRRPDMAGAEVSSTGEWTERAAEERELVIVGDVVTEWHRLAEGRKTIVFGATVRHCEELCRQFLESGVQAALYTGQTSDEERAVLLEGFTPHDGPLRVLISVEALAKGFDVKDVECVCDCRPLRKSLSTAIQMWGRGLRSSPETGKTECLLLDFSGNIIRFADDFSDVYFNGLSKLDEGEKLDKAIREDKEKEPKACPKCGFKPMGKRCISCGFEPEVKSLVESVPGQMREVEMLRSKKLAQDQSDLWAQLATYAKSHSAPEMQQKRAACLYKDIVGHWPPREWRVETAPFVEPSRATSNKIRSLYIAFAKGRGRAAA